MLLLDAWVALVGKPSEAGGFPEKKLYAVTSSRNPRPFTTMAGYGVVASLAFLALCAGTAQFQSTDHLQSNPAPVASDRETSEIAALNKKVEELYQAAK